MIPYRDERSAGSFAAGVWLIIAANVYCFYRELVSGVPARTISEFALVPYNVTHHVQLAPPSPHPYLLTLITSMFLHGGFTHIFFNMLFLAVFGPRIERRMGTIAFVVFYLMCGIAGGVAQTLAAPGSHIPEIGASGAIAGVMGAYIVTYPRSTIDTITPIGCFPLLLRLPAIVVIGIWAALQFFLGFDTFDANANQGGVAYFAHIGGFSFGAIVQGISGLFNRRSD
ncbi:MAG TPA: rhomboid family intramembrane serine protease [Candidatus Baltobacteraceae bacterium]|nr:rhomboid family intramembrane serine protease [Candidatus Baltobacteraceae bacterium]